MLGLRYRVERRQLLGRVSPFGLPCLLLCWWGFVFFYGLDAGPLYRTEGLRARIAQEMFAGDWCVPTLYSEPYLTKPPGMYWAIMLASLPAGEVTPVTARLPSAVAGVVTVFLLTWMCSRFRPGWSSAKVPDRPISPWLFAGLLLPMSFLFLDKAPSAEIDMLQVFWVTAAMACLLRALEREEVRSAGALPWWLLAMGCVAGGFLTKWTAPAFFYLTLVPLLCWRGQLRLLWQPGHLLGVLCAGLLCIAWVVAVARQVGWQPLLDTVSAEALQRLDPHHGGRAYPWGEMLAYPWEVLGANLLWSVLLIPTLFPRFWRERRPEERRLAQLLHCWAWPNLLLWTLMAEHAVRYAMPMCPAVIALGVLFGLDWQHGRYRLPWNWMTPRKAVFATVGLWLAVKIAFVQIVWPLRTATRDHAATGAELAKRVPAGEILYLWQLKDEGTLFYYGRPVQHGPIPTTASSPHYAVLLPREVAEQEARHHVDILQPMTDQQGDPFFLVRLEAR